MLILGRETIIDDIILHNSYVQIKIKGKQEYKSASYNNISWCSPDWFLQDDETIKDGRIVKIPI